MGWAVGDVVVERQVWHGGVTTAVPSLVVAADDTQLVTYITPDAPLWFPDEANFPGPGGRHPWYGRAGWEGHGKLTITPTVGDYAVSHFWHGPDRQFTCWYLNIQEPMRPTQIGFDTQDLELDIVVTPDRRWQLKDDEVLEQRIAEGRWTAEEVEAIRGIGARIVRDVLEPAQWWWDTTWALWEPEEWMRAPAFPDAWRDVPVAPFAGLLA